jgi:hypothetical protein
MGSGRLVVALPPSFLQSGIDAGDDRCRRVGVRETDARDGVSPTSVRTGHLGTRRQPLGIHRPADDHTGRPGRHGSFDLLQGTEDLAARVANAMAATEPDRDPDPDPDPKDGNGQAGAADPNKSVAERGACGLMRCGHDQGR